MLTQERKRFDARRSGDGTQTGVVTAGRLCIMVAVRRMGLFFVFPIVLALATPVSARAGAVIEGTVDLPEAAPLPVSKPRYPVAATYTVGPPDPPAAVVYLEMDEEAGAPSVSATAEIAQHRYQFSPGLLPVRRGTAVRFPNLDDEYHSVFSYSKPKRFDLGRYHRDEVPAEVVFDETGVVKLFCEIHEHMRGTILVLETPWFAKTDTDGRYRLEDVPAGRGTLRVWVDDEQTFVRPVEIREGERLRIDFPASTAPEAS